MPRKGENIYRRRDNRWEGRYKVGFDESGKSRYRSIYGKSYQEVKIKLIALRSAPKEAVSSGRLTVKELFEEWLSAVKLRVKESTYANCALRSDIAMAGFIPFSESLHHFEFCGIRELLKLKYFF